MFEKFKNGNPERLAPSQCIDAYALNFQTERGNLILVMNDTTKLPSPREYSNYNSSIEPGSIQCANDPFD
jgi:hypothetical protein